MSSTHSAASRLLNMLGRSAGALLLAAALSSCSQQRPPATTDIPVSMPTLEQIEAEQLSWWKIRFRIAWPEGTQRDQTVSLLLADAVVSPVIRKHEDNILWWRFHRRAARDGAGHQFSYLLYASPDTADKTIQDLQDSQILSDAIEAGLVEKVIYPDTTKLEHPNVEDYSDPSWSLSIQRNWPSYIMGVSAMWLGLIEEMKQEDLAGETDIDLLYEQYRAINEYLSLVWYFEAQHAFMHHLSAVFGYQPMLIKKEIQF